MITESGQVLQGELLPVPLYFHAIASVNSTTSILSGGCKPHAFDGHPGGCESPLTFYYNHVTQTFMSGPPLNLGRNYHASGTIIDKVTKEEFVVVTGGEIDGGPDDSTEILVDQHWQTGKQYMVNKCEIIFIHGFNHQTKISKEPSICFKLQPKMNSQLTVTHLKLLFFSTN